MALVRFPYNDVEPLEIPERNLMGIFTPPAVSAGRSEQDIVADALAHPVGSLPLAEALSGKRKVLIVSDDHHRPTPVRTILPLVLEELKAAGVPDSSVEIIMALGSHRPMSDEEIRRKLGDPVAERFRVTNHDWTDPASLYF